MSTAFFPHANIKPYNQEEYQAFDDLPAIRGQVHQPHAVVEGAYHRPNDAPHPEGRGIRPGFK
jgi:hypothetical protein